MAKSKPKPSADHEELLGKLRDSLGELLAENIEGIIKNAGTDDVAKCSISIKINNVDSVPQCFSKLRWARRFSAAAEFTCGDPNQEELDLEKQQA